MNDDLAVLVANEMLSTSLDAYFRVVAGWPDAQTAAGLLGRDEAIALTREFRTFHPIVRSLGGVVLDDPHTSDHHVLLCRDAVAGAIMHLAHDGSSRIVFDGLDGFLAATRRAADTDRSVRDEHPMLAPVIGDQAALRGLIAHLRTEPDHDDVVPFLVPSLDLTDTDLLEELVLGEGVYAAEAVGLEIAARPSASLSRVADLCAEHEHVMVRNAGATARARIADVRTPDRGP